MTAPTDARSLRTAVERRLYGPNCPPLADRYPYGARSADDLLEAMAFQRFLARLPRDRWWAPDVHTVFRSPSPPWSRRAAVAVTPYLSYRPMAPGAFAVRHVSDDPPTPPSSGASHSAALLYEVRGYTSAVRLLKAELTDIDDGFCFEFFPVLRDAVAPELSFQAGARVRVRVLYGGRSHEDIVATFALDVTIAARTLDGLATTLAAPLLPEVGDPTGVLVTTSSAEMRVADLLVRARHLRALERSDDYVQRDRLPGIPDPRARIEWEEHQWRRVPLDRSRVRALERALVPVPTRSQQHLE